MFCQLFSLQNKSFLCLQYVENKGFQTVIKHRLKAIQKHIKNELGNREKNTKNAHFVLKKCTFRFRDYTMFIIPFFVLAVVPTFIFLGFRGCEVNRVAPPAANADTVVYADSDTVQVVDTIADGDDFYVEKSNNQNYLNTIDYSSSKVTDR